MTRSFTKKVQITRDGKATKTILSVHYPRPLAAYVNEALEKGFELVDIVEPVPTDTTRPLTAGGSFPSP